MRKQLALTETIHDTELARHLREDALENCVSSFDGFGRETCAIHAALSTNPSKCAKVTFQNLDKANEALLDVFALHLKLGASEEEWNRARTCFFKRHVISHRAGVVDQKYLNETEDQEAILGRRIAVSPAEVEGTIAVLLKLARYLLTHLPLPDVK